MIRCFLVLFIATFTTMAVQADETMTAAELGFLQSFGPWPQVAPPDPGNELSGLVWAEELGERLFSDTVFSGDETLSCASCHVASLAFSDGIPVAVGAGAHVRNSQGLLDVGQQRWFGWDGGADSLWAASLRPMLTDIELDGDIALIASRLRTKPDVMHELDKAGQVLQNDESLVVLAAKSIAAYLRTLQSAPTAFDRYRLAVLDDSIAEEPIDYPSDARRGLSIFFGEANCHVCHFGPNFSNREFHDTGRPFFTAVGRVDAGRYTGIERVRKDPYSLTGHYNGTRVSQEILKTTSVTLSQVNFGQWRTPSLRNLIYTAPYMHDGSLATLREVVDAYADIDPGRIHSNGEAIIRPLDMNDRDREDLVAFLKTLSAPLITDQD